MQQAMQQADSVCTWLSQAWKQNWRYSQWHGPHTAANNRTTTLLCRHGLLLCHELVPRFPGHCGVFRRMVLHGQSMAKRMPPPGGTQHVMLLYGHVQLCRRPAYGHR